MNKEFKIECPSCKANVLIYTTLNGLRYSKKHKVVCKDCKNKIKKDKLSLIYERNCPECNCLLTTKNKYWNYIAIKEKRLCLNCSAKHKVMTDEWRDNMKKNHADFSGEKNPFFGKKHKKETVEFLKNVNAGIDRFTNEYKEKLKIKMTGDKNPFYGKHHNEDTKKILSKPKTLEHKIKLSISLKGKKSKLKGKVISDESRRKMRISAINRIKRDRCVESSMCPSVNKKETSYFEILDKDRGWDGIFYLKNGKKEQFFIKELGYFVDYYEPKLNIVVEYDETSHYNEDWSLKEKDVIRQNEIIDNLKCKFYRYNASLNKFYEITR